MDASVAHHFPVPVAIGTRLRARLAVEEAINPLMEPDHYASIAPQNRTCRRRIDQVARLVDHSHQIVVDPQTADHSALRGVGDERHGLSGKHEVVLEGEKAKKKATALPGERMRALLRV